MRLIDADKADVERINCFYGSECRIADVQEWLDEQPTVDPYDYLKEQGLLVVLPCKIGTRIYRVVPNRSVIWPDPPEYNVIWDTFKLQDVYHFNKTVFLSKEDAEAALKSK